MAKLLIVTLPDTSQTVALRWNEVATERIDCYLVDESAVDMRAVSAAPGDQYRVPLDTRVTSNLVTALREMIMRAQG